MPPTVEQVLALDVDALPAAIAALTSSSELHAFCLRFNLCPTMTLPECFLACDANGTWKAIPLQAEPVFVHALPIAAHIFHQGPRSLFERIANMSAVMNTLNNALNCGASLEGCTLEGPQMHGLPAGLYGAALESMP